MLIMLDSSLSTSGSICGWTSSPGDDEVDMSFPSSSPKWTADTNMNHPSAPLPLTEGAPTSRPSIHRHSISLTIPPTSPVTSHYRTTSQPSPTSRRTLKKQKEDPNYVPRPLNAFMVFRVEFSKIHAQNLAQNVDCETEPEKKLSKRAGEVWGKMSEKDRAPYKAESERLARDHAQKHPGYRYKPRRRQGSSHKPSSNGLSRREQVESFMDRVEANGRSSDHESDHSGTPSAFSSPEPPEIPRRSGTPTKRVRRQRSYSVPLCRAPPQYSRTYLLQPAAAASASGLQKKRSRSTFTRPPSLYMSAGGYSPQSDFSQIPGPGPMIDESFLSFLTFDTNSTAPSSPDTFFDNSFDESLYTGSSLTSPESTNSAMFSNLSVQDLETSVTPPESQASNPLYHLRQRSNTTSMLPPSPLSAVTSSLSNWNGQVNGPSASSSSLPSFGYTSSPPSSVMDSYPLASDPFSAQTEIRGQITETLPDTSSSLLTPTVPMDLDRTPRTSDFPNAVQDAFSEQCSTNIDTLAYPHFPQLDPGLLSASADLECYAAGLDDLSIISPTYTGTPSEELDFSELFNINP